MTQQNRPGWDEAAFVAGLRATFAPLEGLLKPGDAFDYVNYRFFAAPNLNGENEYVVFVKLTEDSPSFVVADEIGETKTWPELAPLPHLAVLALPGTGCFSDMENDVPYLWRWLNWGECELVDETGTRVRMATDAYWKRGGNDPEKLWFTGAGRSGEDPHGASIHVVTCAVVTMNQNG